MVIDSPKSVLFACDHNSVRSPMAEGIAKKYYGNTIFIQSVGVHHDLEVDGFSIAVCGEIDVDISKHKARSFDDMEDWGDQIDGYDLIVALSPASQRRALEYTRYYALEVEYWPVFDPTDLGQTREDKLKAYRQARDQIITRLTQRLGPAIPQDT